MALVEVAIRSPANAAGELHHVDPTRHVEAARALSITLTQQHSGSPGVDAVRLHVSSWSVQTDSQSCSAARTTLWLPGDRTGDLSQP